MNPLHAFAFAIHRITESLWPANIAAYVEHNYLTDLEAHREVWGPGELARAKCNPAFNDLNTINVLRANMSDDDVAFWSDILYLRDLKCEVFALAAERRAKPHDIPADWSMDLASARAQLKDML